MEEFDGPVDEFDNKVIEAQKITGASVVVGMFFERSQEGTRVVTRVARDIPEHELPMLLDALAHALQEMQAGFLLKYGTHSVPPPRGLQ